MAALKYPRPIYFDTAAAALPHPLLGKWMAELTEQFPWNPHGGTCYAEECRRMILKAEERFLSLLNISPSEAKVIWTSGVTEALNLGATVAPHARKRVVFPGAHPALQKSFATVPLRTEKGEISVFYAGPLVQSETGAIWSPSKNLSIGEDDVLLLDGAQVLGKELIPWRELGISLLALSSRKVGGPASVGALVIRNDVAPYLHPLIQGGGQQASLRSGTQDVVGIETFVRAAEEAVAHQQENRKKVQQLRQQLLAELRNFGRRGLPVPQILSPEDGSPWILLCSFAGYEGAVLVRTLAQNEGILLSSASACTAESGEPSPSLLSMGFSEEQIRGALRISFSGKNTSFEVEQLLNALERTMRSY